MQFVNPIPIAWGWPPVPGQLLGGVAGLEPGMRAWLPVHLPPGRYGVFCFVPDTQDGKPHYAHGMIRELVLR
jgi:hypothetical protein